MNHIESLLLHDRYSVHNTGIFEEVPGNTGKGGELGTLRDDRSSLLVSCLFGSAPCCHIASARVVVANVYFTRRRLNV